MKVHYTAKELAGLPGMPRTERGIQIRAARESWPWQKHPGKGGGKEYDIKTLPEATRKFLATVNTRVGNSECGIMNSELPSNNSKFRIPHSELERQRQEARAESMEMFNRLPAWQQKTANAKLAIIHACNQYITTHALAKISGQNSFCYEYNIGRIGVADLVRAQFRQLHPRTLQAWITEEYNLGAMGLVDLYGNRKGQSKIETNPELKKAIDSLLDSKPHISLGHINEFLRAYHPDQPHICDKSIKRYREKREKTEAQRVLLAKNPDKFKSAMQPAFGSRSEGIVALNQLWEFDATPADVMLKEGRHSVLGMIDVYSRRVKLLVSKTSRTIMVNTLMRRSIQALGVPNAIKTDNGKDYTSEHFERVLSDLEIYHDLCDPFSGDQKPHIERVFGTFSRDLVELLPGYIGHNVADRKDIESRKTFAQRLGNPDSVIEINMTAQDFQTFCDDWCETYHNRTHSSLGKSPNQMANEWTGNLRIISDARALDVLLATAPRHGGLRAATKEGIKLDHHWYVDQALVSWIGKGRILRVLHDPEDLGKIIVQAPNEYDIYEHLCVAICPEVLGISRLELAEAANEAWKEHTAQLRADIRRSKAALKNAPAHEIIMQARLKNNSECGIRNAELSTIEHKTAGITAASLAVEALDGKIKAPVTLALTDEEKAVRERIRAQIETPKVRKIGEESALARYHRFKTMRNLLMAGAMGYRGLLTEEEYKALIAYENTVEHKALKKMEETKAMK